MNVARESVFQAKLIKELKKKFPGCVVYKMDPNYIQGTPDLLMLYGDRWAMFECKANEKSTHRPNQDYWVNRLNKMSFAAFIHPKNRKEILDEVQQLLGSRR